MKRNKESALKMAEKIMKDRYPSAIAIFCAGSIMRGEGTDFSDIDIVVLFPQIEFAWRESFMYEGWPIEAFVHDPETLNYFFYDVDLPSGKPALPHMVFEGVPIPEQANHIKTVQDFKILAKQLLDAGPIPLTEADIRNRIYGISDLLDDLRQPRSKSEAIGSAVQLFEQLSDFFLRSKKLWSASGKVISRELKKFDPVFEQKFSKAFEDLFSDGKAESAISLAEEILSPFGGPLFDGYRRDAPSAWKKSL